MLRNISAFTYRHRETEKNLCRGGRSQDFPSTDFEPAVRHLKYARQQYTHGTTNTHKMTTIHTRQRTIHTSQLQQYTRPTNNNYTQVNLKLSTIHTRQIRNFTTCTKGTNTPARQHCVQFIVIVFPQSLIHSRFHPSPSLLITYYSYKCFP
jgi:hypothetical protein